MMHLLLVAAVTASPPASMPADPPLVAGAAHAIEVGRLEQARLMIGQLVRSGLKGSSAEKLMANLAFASLNYEEALGRYRNLATSGVRDGDLCQKAAISALKLGRNADAVPFAECAVASSNADWKAWNARGVLADLAQDWPMADKAYGRARELASRKGEIVNNEGWSLLLRGDWAGAKAHFEQAAAMTPASTRIGNNLELAQAALAADLPARRAGESDFQWAGRLNDAGVAAKMLGDNKRALAAFTRALETSPIWYERAFKNLEAMSEK